MYSCPAAGALGGSGHKAEPDAAADPSLRDGHDLRLRGGEASKRVLSAFLLKTGWPTANECVPLQGTLAQAVKKGHWILLDEINLAAAETLECLSGLLEGSAGSLVLLDRGDTGKSGLVVLLFI